MAEKLRGRTVRKIFVVVLLIFDIKGVTSFMTSLFDH
jgi:hypothetical protein